MARGDQGKERRGPTGTYHLCRFGGESFQAFLPYPLPPDLSSYLPSLQGLLAQANRSLGELNMFSTHLPDSSLLLYYFVRKEAVLSSQIEGTQSSLADLLFYEAKEVPFVPMEDVAEVSSYVKAMEHGLRRVREGFPASLRLIKEMHQILLSKGRGHRCNPGEFRRSQNWIGGSRPGNAVFVPPPAHRLMEFLGPLEEYLHLRERPYPALIDAGLIHVQFETIHPFLDGNGRLGRLLVIFFLIMMGDLRQPNLSLGAYFRRHQSSYYDHLSATRSTGDWGGWLQFILTGVKETAHRVIETGRKASQLLDADLKKIRALKRARISAEEAYGVLRNRGVVTATKLSKGAGMSVPTARKSLCHLRDLGIVQEARGQGKERVYVYQKLMDVFEAGF